jgi:hypothetical protein
MKVCRKLRRHLMVTAVMGLVVIGGIAPGCTPSEAARRDTASPLFVPTVPPADTPTPRPYRPRPTWETTDPELQEKYRIREATRVAVLTNVPQYTPVPFSVLALTPVDYGPPIPPPTNMVYPAGDGMIVEVVGGGPAASQFSLENLWKRDVGDQHIRVYFGTEKYDGTQGLAVVETYAAGQGPTWSVYRTPMLAGEIRVIGAVGERLTVQAEDGTIFDFDVPTRAWIFPQGTPVVRTPIPIRETLP